MFRIDTIRYLEIDGVNYYPQIQLGSRDVFLVVGILFILVLFKDLVMGKWLWPREIVKGLLSFYLAASISISMLPIMILQHRDYFEQIGYGHQNYMEHSSLSEYLNMWNDPISRFQIIGNIVLLIPLVVLMALLYYRFRSIARMFLLVLITSIFIETTQLVLNYYYFSNRVFDIGDIILNTSGGLVFGVIIYYLIKWIFPWFVTDKPVK